MRTPALILSLLLATLVPLAPVAQATPIRQDYVVHGEVDVTFDDGWCAIPAYTGVSGTVTQDAAGVHLSLSTPLSGEEGTPSFSASYDPTAAFGTYSRDCAGGSEGGPIETASIAGLSCSGLSISVTFGGWAAAFVFNGIAYCAPVAGQDDASGTLVSVGVGTTPIGCAGTVELTLAGGAKVPAFGVQLGTGPCDLADPPCASYATAPGVTACEANPAACCTVLFEPTTGGPAIECVVQRDLTLDVNADGYPDVTVPAYDLAPPPCP